jgi:RNA polymerase sigma factor (TIGR02999 family)
VKPLASETTQLLRAWASGNRNALDALTPRVYQELRRLAGHYMRGERPGNTLQTTALVHEAFLRLIDGNSVEWQDRAHFFAVCAQVMRRILLDHARRRLAAKRGGAVLRINVDDALDLSVRRDRELIALDEALEQLSQVDPRKARIVELRFFGGLSVEEVADVLGVSPDTVARDWRLARAWLLSHLKM